MLRDVCLNEFRRIVQHIGAAEQPQEIFDRTGIIEAVADPLIQIEGQIQVLPFHDLPVFDLLCPALSSKGTEDRHGAEIIQVMEYGLDAKGTHIGAVSGGKSIGLHRGAGFGSRD